MPVRVTLSLVLPEWWGADEFWEDGGAPAVQAAVYDDLSAFADEAVWEVKKVNQEKEMI